MSHSIVGFRTDISFAIWLLRVSRSRTSSSHDCKQRCLKDCFDHFYPESSVACSIPAHKIDQNCILYVQFSYGCQALELYFHIFPTFCTHRICSSINFVLRLTFSFNELFSATFILLITGISIFFAN